MRLRYRATKVRLYGVGEARSRRRARLVWHPPEAREAFELGAEEFFRKL